MAEEKKHHHLFHHQKEEEKPVEAVIYSETAYGADGPGQYYESTEAFGYATENKNDDYEKYEKEKKHHKHKEHLGEMGTAAAGAFALVSIHSTDQLIKLLYVNSSFVLIQRY